jgi:hypothetical protein
MKREYRKMARKANGKIRLEKRVKLSSIPLE